MISKIGSLVWGIKNKYFKNPRPSLNDLDRKLSKYLNYRNGFFIEAGGNDGYSQSNTYYLEKKLGWRGLLIEGIPELYEKCRKERRRSQVRNCALVSPDFSETTVTMHFAHLMSVVEGSMKSTEAQESHVSRGVEIQNLGNSYSVEVPARTLESVLDEIDPLPEIDFFSLDVEGFELQVLQGLNLAKYAPKYILVEARFFDEIDALLSDRYEMIEKMSYHDYLYRRKE